jgi:hypothetical protein
LGDKVGSLKAQQRATELREARNKQKPGGSGVPVP